MLRVPKDMSVWLIRDAPHAAGWRGLLGLYLRDPVVEVTLSES